MTAPLAEQVAAALGEHDWLTPRGYAWPCCTCGEEFPGGEDDAQAHQADAVLRVVAEWRNRQRDFASHYELTSDNLYIDGEPLPWFLSIDGPMVEPYGDGNPVHVLWVPILVDGPCPRAGRPDGEPLEATGGPEAAPGAPEAPAGVSQDVRGAERGGER